MKTEIGEILARYFEGIADTAERKELFDWINSSEENRIEFERTEAIYNALLTRKLENSFDTKKGFKEFVNQTKSTKINRKGNPNQLWLRVAASLLLLTVLSFKLYFLINTSKSEIAYFEVNTPKGSKTQLTLTDGTKIWLNANSKLKYPNRFAANERVVYLEGEAFFDVKKDPNHPFIVKTREVNVKALGTSFNVKAYPNEGTVETTLVKGVVLVEQTDESVTKNRHKTIKLTPNQKVTIFRKKGRVLLDSGDETSIIEKKSSLQKLIETSENQLVTTNVNTELYTSWKDNRLIFNNETFESIAVKFERRYGATILFNSEEIKNYRFSGQFPEISIDRALRALQFASPFKFEIKQDTIIINP